jgi:hypothetical protein
MTRKCRHMTTAPVENTVVVYNMEDILTRVCFLNALASVLSGALSYALVIVLRSQTCRRLGAEFCIGVTVAVRVQACLEAALARATRTTRDGIAPSQATSNHGRPGL